jgi:hypothetical protein
MTLTGPLLMQLTNISRNWRPFGQKKSPQRGLFAALSLVRKARS